LNLPLDDARGSPDIVKCDGHGRSRVWK
jgi:hypothetical protein